MCSSDLHLAGSGPGFPPEADAALAPLAEALERGDPRTRRLWFDLTTVAGPNASNEELALVARRIRQIGPERALFGADLSIGGNPPPAEAWALFRSRVPLTEAEFATIAGNVAPYLR